MKSLRLLLALCTLTALLSSCSSITRVGFTVERPPEVNVRPFKKMVVDPIESSSAFKNDGAELRNVLIDKLLSAQLFDAVSDARPVDNNVASTLVLSGAISADEYHETKDRSQETVGRKVKNPVTKKDTVIKDSIVYHNTTRGNLRMSAQLRLRDAAQNAIVWSTSFDIEKSATSKADNARPADIYVPGLRRDAVLEIADRLVQSFLVKKEWANIELVEDSDLPELEQGNDAASDKDWQRAVNLYNDAMLKHAASSKLHMAQYDFACVNMAIGNYDSAIRHFDKALQGSDDDRYRRARTLCLRIQNDANALKAIRGY